MSADLKPCPFCECADSDMPPVETKDRHGHLVICTACSAIGPTRTTAPDAVAAWNRRTTATPGALDPATVAPSCAPGEVAEWRRSVEILRRALAWHGDPQRMATTREEWQQEVDAAIVWVKDNPEPDRLSFSTLAALSPQGLDAKEGGK